MKKINMILTLVFLTGCTVANQPIVAKLDNNKTEIKQPVKSVNNDIKTQQNGLPVNVVESPIPSVIQTPLVSNPVASPISEPLVSNNISNVPPATPDCSVPTPFPSTSPIPGFPHPGFEDVLQVPEGTRDSAINIFFKDYQKIRYDFEKKVFITKACADVTNLNNLTNQYNVIKVIQPASAIGKTEEELSKQEKDSEEFYGVDIPNKGSIYYFEVKNTNIKEFVEKLRQDPNVRSANEMGTGGTAS